MGKASFQRPQADQRRRDRIPDAASAFMQSDISIFRAKCPTAHKKLFRKPLSPSKKIVKKMRFIFGTPLLTVVFVHFERLFRSFCTIFSFILNDFLRHTRIGFSGLLRLLQQPHHDRTPAEYLRRWLARLAHRRPPPTCVLINTDLHNLKWDTCAGRFLGSMHISCQRSDRAQKNPLGRP